MVDNNQRVYLVILRHEGPCFFLSSISYENFQHCKLVWNAVGLYRESEHVPCPAHRRVCVEVVGNGSQQAMGQAPPWQSSGTASGMLVVHRHAELLPLILPRGGKPSDGLAVSPQLLHLGSTGGREEAGTQSLLASKLIICRHCRKSWLFCTHYGTFFFPPPLHNSQVSFSFSAIEK